MGAWGVVPPTGLCHDLGAILVAPVRGAPVVGLARAPMGECQGTAAMHPVKGALVVAIRGAQPPLVVAQVGPGQRQPLENAKGDDTVTGEDKLIIQTPNLFVFLQAVENGQMRSPLVVGAVDNGLAEGHLCGEEAVVVGGTDLGVYVRI